MALPSRRDFVFAALQPGKRREVILRKLELVMGPLPSGARSPLEPRTESETRAEGYTRTLLTYCSETGDRVPAYLLAPAAGKPPFPAAICLHQTTAIGKAEPAGLGGKPNLHYAHELAVRGFVCIAPDYPNFGGYKFDPYANGYASATMKGIWNHIRAIDLLQSLPAVNPNPLFLAAFDTRVRAVVSSCGFTSFRRYKGGDLAGWSHRGYMPRIASDYAKDPARMPFDFSDVLEAIAPRPVFVNAPMRDDNFDPQGVDEAANGQPHVTVRHPDAAHDFPRPIREEAYIFLARSVQR
jgi:hypothetical protein